MTNQNDVPLYSSRITNTYLEYLNKYYPDLDIDSILNYAGMTRHEVEDPGHWFTQMQVDRFYEKTVEKTGNVNIAREVGRHLTSGESTGAVKQYGLGLLNPLSVYLMIENFYRIISRGANAKAKKIGSNKVEIIVKPKDSTQEKPHQCENRIGSFESLAKAFTGNFAKVQQHECYHKGDPYCRYIIEWKRTAAILWRIFRNYFLIASMMACFVLYFLLPILTWSILSLSLAVITLILSLYVEQIEKKELYKTIESQGNAAKDLVSEINIRHNNSLLVQEIGMATATIVDIDILFETVVASIKKYLFYDRGMILLPGFQSETLTFHTGYGYSNVEEDRLRQMAFSLLAGGETSVFALCFQQQRPYLFNNLQDIRDGGIANDDYFKTMRTQSLICTPIIYEKQCQGVLVVENKQSSRKLTQSDMSLLIGISSQIAVGINNTLFFKKIRDSEKKLEMRVEQRTAELEQVNRELSIEIAERLKSEQRLMDSLKEKDVLLKEVHHRVKNNLQIIASLLDMSKRRATHPETVDLLNEALSKIYTMSLIHSQLYQSDRFDEINMGKNIRELVNQLSQFYLGDRNIELSIDAPDIYLSVTQALPCALVVNELVSNAFKYAFRGSGSGRIEIVLQKLKHEHEKISLKVMDNGIGIPGSIDISNTETLGFKLVRNLIIKQLKGKFTIKCNAGTTIDIEFPIVA